MRQRTAAILLVAFFSLLNAGSSFAAQIALPSFADLVEQLSPSVVNISTTQKPDDSENNENGVVLQGVAPDGMMASESPQNMALGSGFVISDGGYILTNSHVVDNASDVSVIFSDNTSLQAKIIGSDAKTDLALLKVESPQTLMPVKFGDSDKIRVGDWILAIGNPFGLGGSVTAGIVSAKSRDIESGPYDNFIQTDASINQGSSGGPMFNLDGEVIGINTAIFSTTGVSQGIGFAIPSNLTHFVIEQLIKNGKVRRGWIGVRIQPNSEEISHSLGLQENQGIVVSGFADNSPAQKAGLEAGDIILTLDNTPVINARDFSRRIAETAVGQMVSVEIWRNHQKHQIKMTVEEMPEEVAAKPIKIVSEIPLSGTNQTDLDPLEATGLKLEDLDQEAIERFHLHPDSHGIIITHVSSGSQAEMKGLKAGDIIRQVDKKEVHRLSDVQNAVADAVFEDYRPVLLSVQTGENIHFVALKIRPSEVEK